MHRNSGPSLVLPGWKFASVSRVRIISIWGSYGDIPGVVVCHMNTFALVPLFTAVAMANWSGSSNG